MKKTWILLSVILLGITLFICSSCQKDGATGPQGPRGPAGQNGNSNITSKTFTMTSWPFSAPYYYSNLSVPELTTNNIDSAMVMVYFSTVGSVWLALPYTQYHSPYNYYMGFNTSAGNVQVTWFYDSSLSSGSDPNTYYGTTIRCKVVIIPPALIRPAVNYKSYEQVKASYDLKE